MRGFAIGVFLQIAFVGFIAIRELRGGGENVVAIDYPAEVSNLKDS